MQRTDPAPAHLTALAAQGDLPSVQAAVQDGLSPFQVHHLLQYASNAGQVETVRWLMTQVDPSAFDSSAFQGACTHGHLECAELLFTAKPSSRALDQAMEMACVHGHADVARFIWAHLVGLHGRRGEYLCIAAQSGHLACVKAFQEWGIRHPDALAFAATGGSLECVEVLLLQNDPKANHSLALLCAALHGHTACTQLLAPLSEPQRAWAWACSRGGYEKALENLADYVPHECWQRALRGDLASMPVLAARWRAHEERVLLEQATPGHANPTRLRL